MSGYVAAAGEFEEVAPVPRRLQIVEPHTDDEGPDAAIIELRGAREPTPAESSTIYAW